MFNAAMFHVVVLSMRTVVACIDCVIYVRLTIFLCKKCNATLRVHFLDINIFVGSFIFV